MNITLRKAEPSDSYQVFQWRNHPEVRKFSLDGNELDYESHQSWYRKVLASENHVLLIGVRGGENVGVIRYDLDEGGDRANVSIYVRPGLHGQGIGTQLMRAGESWLKQHHAHVRKMTATVLKGNEVSLKLFQNAGFEPDAILFTKRLSSSGV